jgi:hypothetical protein
MFQLSKPGYGQYGTAPLVFEVTRTRSGDIYAQVTATPAFPKTPFLASTWPPEHKYNAAVVAVVEASYNLSGQRLRIHAFYSKAATHKCWPLLAPVDRVAVGGGVGRRLLLSVLEQLPARTVVSLQASGGFPWDWDLLCSKSKTLAAKTIHAQLGITHYPNQNPRHEWCEFQSNQRLVAFYANLGFRVQQRDDYLAVTMVHSAGKLAAEVRKKKFM